MVVGNVPPHPDLVGADADRQPRVESRDQHAHQDRGDEPRRPRRRALLEWLEGRAGYAERAYSDKRLANLSGPTFDASLVWIATPLTTVSLRGSTAFNETTIVNASGAVNRSLTLDISHALMRNLTISAGYSAARSTHLIRGAVMLNTNPFIPAGVAGPTNFIRLDTAALLNDNFGRMRWRITDANTAYHALRAITETQVDLSSTLHAARQPPEQHRGRDC